MKKGLIYLFMLVMSITSFTACNDDEDDDNGGKVTDNAEVIAGIYKGGMVISFSNVETTDSTVQNIFITRTDKDIVKLELKKFKFSSIPVGDIVIENINVLGKDGVYTFTASQELTLVVGKVTVNVTGTITNDKAILKIIVKDVVGVGDVTVDFTGNKIEALSTEALITEMTFSDTIVLGQPRIDGTTINFYVAENADSLALILKPTITVSEGASVTPASETKVDFNTPVTYTVVAEDGTTTTTYTVICFKGRKDNFSVWNPSEETDFPYTTPAGWASSNQGVYFIKAMYATGAMPGTTEEQQEFLKNVPFAVVAADGGAKVETINSIGFPSAMPGYFPAVPNVTAGTLFLGEFDMSAAVSNTLKGTKFGIPYYTKPLEVKGLYKYTPGTEYLVCSNPTDSSNFAVADPSKSDQFAISAVLYEVPFWETVNPDDEYDQEFDQRLNGLNIYSSDRIVASAQMTGGAQTSFKEFSLKLNYIKDYNSSKLYRFAVIFSSSKDGDKFTGAPGSALTVDDVEIISE